MKIVTYKCDECGNEISESDFLQIRTVGDCSIAVMNNVLPEGKDIYFDEVHFCSKSCLVDFFFGKQKLITEPVIESGIEIDSTKEAIVFDKPDEIKEDVVWNDEELSLEKSKPDVKEKKKSGWPKGKPRGSKVAENFKKNHKEE